MEESRPHKVSQLIPTDAEKRLKSKTKTQQAPNNNQWVKKPHELIAQFHKERKLCKRTRSFQM
jgi:hypothetical protein